MDGVSAQLGGRRGCPAVPGCRLRVVHGDRNAKSKAGCRIRSNFERTAFVFMRLSGIALLIVLYQVAMKLKGMPIERNAISAMPAAPPKLPSIWNGG